MTTGARPVREPAARGIWSARATAAPAPAGTVQRGIGKCVPPKEDPGDPPWNPIRDMLNMMGASSAAHGGGGSSSMILRTAQSGSPAIDSALVALAAVKGQAAAAALAFGEGKPDRAFRRTVRAARAKPPTVVAGTGLDAASAAALNKLFAAEARAYALAAASAKALWRARAAKARGQRALARRQLRASSKFAGQAASALKRVPALRSAAASRAHRRRRGRGRRDRGSGHRVPRGGQSPVRSRHRCEPPSPRSAWAARTSSACAPACSARP